MIQSFSDIITNSSSEVFVIESNDHEKIKTFLADVCEVFGWDVNDLMHFESVEEDGEEEPILCAIEDDEELETVYNLIMEQLYEEEDVD